MAEYRPSLPFSTLLLLLIPVHETVKGVAVKRYPDDGILLFGSFRTYGGTETSVNDVLTVIDTAIIETWYRPDIKSDCHIMRPEDNAVYEIIGEPENINMRNQFLRFKVRRIKGGA